jgi:hypothetical protein
MTILDCIREAQRRAGLAPKDWATGADAPPEVHEPVTPGREEEMIESFFAMARTLKRTGDIPARQILKSFVDGTTTDRN